jgi:hypothetical protein
MTRTWSSGTGADLQATGILIFSRTEIVNELIPEERFSPLGVLALAAIT